VIERGEQTRLTLEARQPLGVARDAGRNTLIATSRPRFVSVAR